MDVLELMDAGQKCVHSLQANLRVKQYTKCLELGQPEVVYHGYNSGTQWLSSELAMEPKVKVIWSG